MAELKAITAKLVRKLLIYDSTTGEFCNRITRRGRAIAGTIAKSRKDGYVRIQLLNNRHFAHRLAWLYVYGIFPDGQLDHINGDPSDNRISNLRIATSSQNIANSRKRSDNSSGYKGVSWHACGNNWSARIWKNGKKLHIGCYSTKEEAAAAYASKAKELHEEFARIE